MANLDPATVKAREQLLRNSFDRDLHETRGDTENSPTVPAVQQIGKWINRLGSKLQPADVPQPIANDSKTVLAREPAAINISNVDLIVKRGDDYVVQRGGTFLDVAKKAGFSDPEDAAKYLMAINPELTEKRSDGRLKAGDVVHTTLNMKFSDQSE